MTIVVTGATGNVGSRVIRELRARGVAVRVFVRDPEKAARMLSPNLEVVTGDFGDANSVRAALTGADALLLSCPNHPCQADYERGVIDAAVAQGVRRIVKLSTIGAEVGSPLEFWDAHGRAEAHLRASMPSAVILQSNFYMSNLLGAADTVRGMGKLFAPADGVRVAMIDPGDVAAVAANALVDGHYDGRTLVLSGPETMTYGRVAEDLSRVTGRPVEFVAVPDEAARRSMLGAGMPEWVVGNVVTLFGVLRTGVAKDTTDTVRRVTGVDPRPFTVFATEHAELFGGARVT